MPVGLTLSTNSWRYAWRITSITSQKGERSIGTVSSGVVQESHTVSTSSQSGPSEVPKVTSDESRLPRHLRQKGVKFQETVSSGSFIQMPISRAFALPFARPLHLSPKSALCSGALKLS